MMETLPRSSQESSEHARKPKTRPVPKPSLLICPSSSVKNGMVMDGSLILFPTSFTSNTTTLYIMSLPFLSFWGLLCGYMTASFFGEHISLTHRSTIGTLGMETSPAHSMSMLSTAAWIRKAPELDDGKRFQPGLARLSWWVKNYGFSLFVLL